MEILLFRYIIKAEDLVSIPIIPNASLSLQFATFRKFLEFPGKV